jgi:hypothetical protein
LGRTGAIVVNNFTLLDLAAQNAAGSLVVDESTLAQTWIEVLIRVEGAKKV